MQRLQGKVAAITGAGSGIGRAIAKTYTAEGASVAVLDKDVVGAQETVESIRQDGGRSQEYIVDVSDHDGLRHAVHDVSERFGALDILVNNAGIESHGTVMETPLEDWRHVMSVNLDAVYVGSKAAAEIMVPQRRGWIVNISSIQAFMTTGSVGAYNASKAGMVGLTHSLAVELAPFNVVVNAIAPGVIRTAMSVRPDGTDETKTADFVEHYVKRRRIPLARSGEPEDVAGTALFLVSDECRYMTGQLLIVDGGLSLTI